MRRAGLPRWLALAAAAVALQAASFALAPWFALPPRAVFVMGFGCVVAVVLAVAAAAPTPAPKTALLLVVAAAVLAAVAASGPVVGPSKTVLALVTATLLLGGTLAGGIVGGRIQRAGHLLVVAYVSSIADVYSVWAPQGVTAQVVQSERALAVMALSWPLAMGDEVAAYPLLGVADVIMTALYLTAAHRLGLGRRRTVIALAVGYAAVGALLLWRGEALPALPVLGLAVLAAHPQARRIPAGEGRTAIAGMAVLTAVFAALWWIR